MQRPWSRIRPRREMTSSFCAMDFQFSRTPATRLISVLCFCYHGLTRVDAGLQVVNSPVVPCAGTAAMR